jgi:hypothetical protein
MLTKRIRFVSILVETIYKERVRVVMMNEKNTHTHTHIKEKKMYKKYLRFNQFKSYKNKNDFV